MFKAYFEGIDIHIGERVKLQVKLSVALSSGNFRCHNWGCLRHLPLTFHGRWRCLLSWPVVEFMHLPQLIEAVATQSPPRAAKVWLLSLWLLCGGGGIDAKGQLHHSILPMRLVHIDYEYNFCCVLINILEIQDLRVASLFGEMSNVYFLLLNASCTLSGNTK